jgi:putative chitobiose transport system permease protein
VISEPITWLAEEKGAMAAVILTKAWLSVPLFMAFFLAGLQGLPAELYEAAALDGSHGWRRHLDITLPLMRPYVALVAVIAAIGATKVFEEVFLMTQGGPADSTRTVVYYVYDLAFSELDISYACTVGLALFVLVLLLSLLRSLVSGDRLVA